MPTSSPAWSADRARPEPSGAGAPRPDRYYATRLRQLAHLELDEAEAGALWREVGQHRWELQHRLGRDVGQRVALLDYVTNIRPQLEDPQIIDGPALQHIERLAVVDALTGLLNRGYFDTQLAREVERCRRYGATGSLLLLDLDRFKPVNDRYGHEAGDEVLRRVGAVILEHVRAPDIPCRFGGDEFAVLLPDTSREEARLVGERIRVAIETAFACTPVQGRFVAVTASVGVATTPEGSSTETSLFQRADTALYDAKRGRRDRLGDNRAPRPGVLPLR